LSHHRKKVCWENGKKKQILCGETEDPISKEKMSNSSQQTYKTYLHIIVDREIPFCQAKECFLSEVVLRRRTTTLRTTKEFHSRRVHKICCSNDMYFEVLNFLSIKRFSNYRSSILHTQVESV